MSQSIAQTFETSRVFEWHRTGGEKYLICTEMRLRNVSPGFQEVAGTRKFEVTEASALWAQGVAFADEVEAEDYLVSLGA